MHGVRARIAPVTLSFLDSSLILVYFAAVLLIGVYFARKHSSSDDYFLAGRRLGWGVIGFSLFASNISSTTLIGLAGEAYSTGIAVSAYEWMAAVILVFFAIFVAPYYIRARIYTIPEYLERRFRPACRYYFSGLTIISSVFVDTAGTLYAGALVVNQFFPAIPMWQSAAALAVVAGFYTAAGGLSAVVYTDVIQAVVLLIGSSVIAYLSLERVGSFANVAASVDPSMLSLIQPADHPTMPWPGLLFGVPIIGFYFWCTNQYITQRILGARDVSHARWGAIFAGLLKTVVLYIMVFPGVMAVQMFPGLERPDYVFPTLVSELLPSGLRGLVLAGFIAAIMSSLDSTLNSASTLVTIDFIQKAKPQLSDRALARIGRITTITVMLVSVAWIPVVASADTLFEYLQESLSYLVPPVVAIFLLGMFWKRTTGTAALVGLIGGHALAILTFLGRFAVSSAAGESSVGGLTRLARGVSDLSFGLFEIHFLYIAIFLFCVSAIAVVIVSLLTAAPDLQQTREYTWSRSVISKSTSEQTLMPWYKDYRLHAAVVLLVVAVMVWVHR